MEYRRIYGGTPAGNESRCDTCAYARIIKGYAESERITVCDYSYPPLPLPFKVQECSDYADKRLPEFKQMEKIALDLTWVKSNKVAGYQLPSHDTKGTEQTEDDDQDDA